MRRFGKGISIAVSCALPSPSSLPPRHPRRPSHVNTQSDTTVAGGCVTEPVCSLRDAVTAANTSADADDTIAIPSGVTRSSPGRYLADGPLTIRRAGARMTTIDAQGASRVLNLGAGPFAVEDLTVTGGFASATALESFAGDGGGIPDLLRRCGVADAQAAVLLGNVANLNGAGIAAPTPESTITGVEKRDR